MITVNRRATFEGVTAAQIFAALSDPNQIGQLLPRVQKVEMLSRDDAERRARLATYMAMGGLFGTIRCEGDLTWEEPSEILFKVTAPLPVETRWTITDTEQGAVLRASMSLDLAPMLGPMAQFVPTDTVADMLAKELETAIRAIARSLQGLQLRERAIAA